MPIQETANAGSIDNKNINILSSPKDSMKQSMRDSNRETSKSKQANQAVENNGNKLDQMVGEMLVVQKEKL